MMKNLQLPLNFSQLTQFQWLFPLVKSCWLTWLIMITLPAYSWWSSVPVFKNSQ